MSPLTALVPETPFLYFTAVSHFSSLIHFNQKQRWATALKEQLILGVKEQVFLDIVPKASHMLDK